MYTDAHGALSEGQAVTAQAVSTNSFDTGAAGNDVTVGNVIFVGVFCTVAMTDSGSDSTLAIEFVDDDNAALSSPTTLATLYTFPATSAAGTYKILPLPWDLVTQRYIGLQYTPANGNLTTGTFDAYLLLNGHQWKAYADGFTIS